MQTEMEKCENLRKDLQRKKKKPKQKVTCIKHIDVLSDAK